MSPVVEQFCNITGWEATQKRMNLPETQYKVLHYSVNCMLARTVTKMWHSKKTVLKDMKISRPTFSGTIGGVFN